MDLPGFTRQSPPLRRISVDAYAEFLAARIRDLSLRSYLLGGISFGFLVVCRTPLAPGCRGILAMEPFLGDRSLLMKPATPASLRGGGSGP